MFVNSGISGALKLSKTAPLDDIEESLLIIGLLKLAIEPLKIPFHSPSSDHARKREASTGSHTDCISRLVALRPKILQLMLA